MMIPKISVIMPVYNENKLELTRSINAILDQTLAPLELIIIDDNPRSIKLKKFLLSIRNNKLRILFNRINLGAGMSRNKGLKASKGLYIAFTDADDISDKTRFEKQFDFLNRYKLDFVFSNSREINNKGKLIRHYVYKSKKIVNQKRIRYVLTHCTNMANQSTWLFKRNILNFVHGYRSLIVEDYDFVLRLLLSNCRLGYQPDVLISREVRMNGITQEHYLKQYLVAKIIRKYFNSYRKVIPINLINNILPQYFNKYEINKFQMFLNYGHKLKINPNISTLYNFIMSIFQSKNALVYLLNDLSIHINQIFMGIYVNKSN